MISITLTPSSPTGDRLSVLDTSVDKVLKPTLGWHVQNLQRFFHQLFMIAAAITLVVYFPLVSFDKQPFVAEGTFRFENGESFRNIAQIRDPTYFKGKGYAVGKTN